MKLFVTGGTGFVGSHFLEHAHAAGHTVVALRRPGSRPRLELKRQPLWVDGALDGDHAGAMEGCEVFVHLASHTPNPPYDSLERCLYWNVVAAVRLAQQGAVAGIRRFLIAGTCFEYGLSADRFEAIPTDAPLEPDLTYPISKAAASTAFLGMARQQVLELQLLRIFQVYGEAEQETRFWPALRKAALAGSDFPMSAGTQVRDFIPVESVAAAFTRALDFAGVVAGQPVVRHVASGEAQSLIVFASRWWQKWHATGRLLPGSVAMRPNERMRIVAAVSAAAIEPRRSVSGA